MKTNLLFRVTMLICISIIFSNKMLAQSDNVGLCGPAALNGWTANGPVMMIQDKTNLSMYTFNGYLNTGELKFSTNAGWTPCWGPVTSGTAMPSIGYTGALVAADNKFNIETAGNYAVTIDLTALTVNIQPMAETTPIKVNRLFIIGSATANGWNLATAPELTKTVGNPWEYTYTGALLSAGSFKLATSKGDFGQKFYVKTSDVLMNLGGADVQWSVPTNGNYRVTVNTNTMAISIASDATTVIQNQTKEYPLLVSNVVSEVLKIENSTNFNYQIINLAGAKVFAGNCDNGSITVSNLNKGIYLLKADNKTFRFIKK